ncbi:MAG: sulfurtransferase [Acidobacteria bacterium RBG_16_68_9]|nr:MAG: sulfurtransferase [Acidobacteria bacterium RBG_16_68_9]
MTTERAVRLLAGALVGLSLILGHLASPWWHLIAAFVSLNLMQSAFTGLCPAEKMLRRLGTT